MNLPKEPNDKKSAGPQLIAKKMIEHYSYSLNDLIGKGFSSKVYKGKNEKTGELVAIKVIDMKMVTNEVEKSLLSQEINALKSMSSPNILKLYNYYHTQNNTYLITEYCHQGDLASILQKSGTIPEVEASKILKHIINGYKEQIKKGIVHRDIKPANIFLRNGIPKIADYGFSKMLNAPKEKIYYNVGTPLYMCPQAIKLNQYSDKSDIWSIGVLYYELLYGQVPWQAPSEKELVDKICNAPPQFYQHIGVSEESKDFILKCLSVDEEKRISTKELDYHPLFLRRNTTTLQKPKALQPNTFNEGLNTTNLHDNKNNNRSFSNNKQNQQMGKTSSPSPDRGMSNYLSKRTEELKKISQGQQQQNGQIGQHRTMKSNQFGKIEEEQQSNIYGKPLSAHVGGQLIQPTIQHMCYKGMNSTKSSDVFSVNDDIINSHLIDRSFWISINPLSEIEVAILHNKEHYDKDQQSMGVQFKNEQLKDLSEKGLNTLRLQNCGQYLENNGLQKFNQIISESHKKYQEHFNKIYHEYNSNKILKDELIIDQKFLNIFDQTQLEFESFYNFLAEYLTSAIRELNHILRLQLSSDTLTTTQEAGIILLDYFVFYRQLCLLILDNFESPLNFMRQCNLNQVAEGRPAKLSLFNYKELRQKIYNLKI